MLTFEENYGIKLPADYRDFMKKYNGGYHPDREIIRFNRGRGTEDTYLRHLFSIQELTIHLPNEYNSPLLKKGFLTIGGDIGKNSFLVSLRLDDYGVVYFHDTDYIFAIENEKFQSVYIVATSFSEFLNKLITSERQNINKKDM